MKRNFAAAAMVKPVSHRPLSDWRENARMYSQNLRVADGAALQGIHAFPRQFELGFEPRDFSCERRTGFRDAVTHDPVDIGALRFRQFLADRISSFSPLICKWK